MVSIYLFEYFKPYVQIMTLLIKQMTLILYFAQLMCTLLNINK